MKFTKENIIKGLEEMVEFCIKMQKETIDKQGRDLEYYFYGGYKWALKDIIKRIKELE